MRIIECSVLGSGLVESDINLIIIRIRIKRKKKNKKQKQNKKKHPNFNSLSRVQKIKTPTKLAVEKMVQGLYNIFSKLVELIDECIHFHVHICQCKYCMQATVHVSHLLYANYFRA